MTQKTEGKSSKKSRIVSVYQLKVTLKGIMPPIWRRFQVTDDITLPKLHRILQVLMGWEGYHLHVFEIGGVNYSMPSPGEVDLDEMGMKTEKRVKLSKLALAEKSRFIYEYDLGGQLDTRDWWRRYCPLTRKSNIRSVSREKDRLRPRTAAASGAMRSLWRLFLIPRIPSMTSISTGRAAISIPRSSIWRRSIESSGGRNEVRMKAKRW